VLKKVLRSSADLQRSQVNSAAYPQQDGKSVAACK